jgi:hypothetical protein
MARGKHKTIDERDLGGFKYFKILAELTESLHAIYTPLRVFWYENRRPGKARSSFTQIKLKQVHYTLG